MKILLFGLLFSVLSCNNSNDNRHVAETTQGHPPDDINKNFTEDSVFRIEFPGNSSSVTIKGKLKGINKPITVFIPVDQGNQLNVLITPEDSIANIRIYQVFMPDGKVDGPFGKNLQLKIAQKGEYKLVIGENLMQGDEWKGRFALTVSLK